MSISPSDHILKEVEKRELLICELPFEIAEVVIKEKPITFEIAKKLESIFNLNSDTWLELQKEYDNTQFKFWSIKIGNKLQSVAGRNLSAEDAVMSVMESVVEEDSKSIHLGLAVELSRRQYVNLLRSNFNLELRHENSNRS